MMNIVTHGARGARAALAWSASALVSFVTLCPVATGQDEVVEDLGIEYTNKDPLKWPVDQRPVGDPWWHERLDERFAKELREGRTVVVLRRLAAELTELDLPPEPKRSFENQVDRVLAAFEAALLEQGMGEGIDTLQKRSAMLARLNGEGLGSQSLMPQSIDLGDGDFALVFFAETPQEIRPVEPVDAGWRLLVSPEDMRRLVLASHGFSHVLGRFVTPLQNAQYEHLVMMDEKWRNYLFEGYSQYPWEAAFNGWVLDFEPFEPPTSQWILFHPTVGVAFSTTSFDEIRAKGVMNIELLGWLKYRGDRNERYLGGSITASFRDDLGPGLGVLAHWSRGFSLGAAWHDQDDDDNLFNDSPFVYLSLDLYRYAQGELPKFQARYAQVEGLLQQFN